MIDYLHAIRGWAKISINFKEEIHNIFYLSHNNHVDLTDNCRVLTDFCYGYIYFQEDMNIWHMTSLYRRDLHVIDSSFIKCTINSKQIININKKRNYLLQEIRTYKIIKDMCRTTSLIISKKLNNEFNWI